ncbi:hypothetical protein HJC23_000265 [Cyclotella cryptica]|uniref:Uncharacterized protein n=1 Tax=Cyclotella cryptica TaxID=29204 RepID=A0ABD3QBG2_9STRA|eukprot:CCRYP_006837-RA/>CCRYP_006837-RA protein AED:0.24 eAED:0.24 QI:0/-1/0/1/-1/1/1/0/318
MQSTSRCETATHRSDDGTNDSSTITLLGFGSLLSETSARLTFPTLQNFRLGRVPHHRRVFAHPASIFFRRGIANLDTLEMSSLSVEYAEGQSFVCSLFEVTRVGLEKGSNNSSDSGGGGSGMAGEDEWIPSRAFLEREEEFEIVMVPYYEDVGYDMKRNGRNNNNDVDDRVNPESEDEMNRVPQRMDTSVSTNTSELSFGEKPHSQQQQQPRMGVICRRSTDEAYIARWGQSHFDKQYKKYGIDTIWNWSRDSGLKPCPVYMRHCVLASRRCGEECYASFLDDTFLVDRRTTLREYLMENPHLMEVEPPEELRERYGG